MVPLTCFDGESEAEGLANQGNDTLSKLGIGAANLLPLVSETFAELAMNAVQHAESVIGA